MSNYYEIEWEDRYGEEFLSKVKDGDRVKYLNVTDKNGYVVCNFEHTWLDKWDRPQEHKFKEDNYTYLIFDVSENNELTQTK